jgi:hypothetical protein
MKRTAFHLTTFDFVGLILLFALFFISLRLFFIFEVVRSPCAEMLATIGSGQGLPSVMKMNYFIAIIFGMFWVSVAINASIVSKLSMWRIAWYQIILIGIVFLGLFNRAYVPQNYVKSPDGTLVVAINDDLITEPRWAEYGEGIWYADGMPACVWIEDNKIALATDWMHEQKYSIRDALGLGRRHIDLLIENQTYRALTDYERQRFEKKKACQSDFTLYGKSASVCEREYLYPVETGLTPPDHVIEILAPELLILKTEKPSD